MGPNGTPGQAAARSRYRRTASGATTATIATDHRTVAATGCTSGQASETCGEGLPNSSRIAPATALSGLYSAISFSGVGSPAIGTKIADRNIIGNSTVKPTVCAVSP